MSRRTGHPSPPSAGPQVAGRVPPADIAAEMSVLGAMMLGDPGAADRALTMLFPEHFYRDSHGHIFAAMAAIRGRSEPIDPVTLADELSRRGTLEQLGGLGYLMQLGDIEFTTANLAHYAKIVREKATLRRLIETCGKVAAMAYAGQEDAAALLEEAEREVLALRPQDEEDTCVPLKPLMQAELDAIEERGKAGDLITGVDTGFDLLNWYTSGLQPGDMILLAARPSVGKTALATNIATNVAKAGGSALFFSLEMSRQMVVRRILSAESRVNGHDVRTGLLKEVYDPRTGEDVGDWKKMMEATKRLWDTRLHIDDNTLVSPAYLRAKCRRVRAEFGLDLIVVDYIGLMSCGDGRAPENRNLEISGYSKALKAAAKEFRCPVLVLSQLSRAVDRRENKRPILSDLRDSGSLEQDADVVMFLHREGYVGGGTADEDEGPSKAVASIDPYRPDPTELIIRKQRNGPTGTLKLMYMPAYARFENVAAPQETEQSAGSLGASR